MRGGGFRHGAPSHLIAFLIFEVKGAFSPCLSVQVINPMKRGRCEMFDFSSFSLFCLQTSNPTFHFRQESYAAKIFFCGPMVFCHGGTEL